MASFKQVQKRRNALKARQEKYQGSKRGIIPLMPDLLTLDQKKMATV